MIKAISIYTLLFYFILFSTAEDGSDLYRTINITGGSIRGRMYTTSRERQGYVFLGIPMAQAPIGPLRFKEAVPIKRWNGTVDCFHYKFACPQKKNKIRNPNVTSSEDCLHNNVLTSRTCLEKGNCSVLAFVHGGNHEFLSPASTWEENLINNFANEDRNVIFVSLPFRVGIFSWLNIAPGLTRSYDTNLGNKDILFALLWIQKEIHHFGGDAKKVTLVGHSAGGESVLEVIFSPLSEGLLNQAVIYSPPFTGNTNENVNRKYSQKLAVKIGCAKEKETFLEHKQIEKVIKCLREKPWFEMLAIQETFEDEVETIDGIWVDGPSGFFPSSWDKLINKKLPKMKFMIGTVSSESKASMIIINSDGRINSERLNSMCSHLAYENNYERPESFRKACVNHYNTAEKVLDFSDDVIYHYPVVRFANKFSENGDCYVYSFEYFTPFNASQYSPGHAEDLNYVLWAKYENFSEKDYKIEEIYSGMLVNFVKTGDPSWQGQKWDPWNKNKRNHFLIDFDEKNKMPGMKLRYHGDIADFYDDTVPRLAGKSRPPIDFPLKHDVFKTDIMLNSIQGAWANTSRFYKKTPRALKEEHALWEYHLIHLKKITAENNDTSINWLPLIIIFFGAIVLGVGVYLLITKWNKRSGYDPLPTEDAVVG